MIKSGRGDTQLQEEKVLFSIQKIQSGFVFYNDLACIIL